MSTTQSIVYLNGHFIEQDKAYVSITDRGFLLGDGVYEVIPVFNGYPFHLSAHIARLYRSLSAIRLDIELKETDWVDIVHQLIEKNGAGNQSLYIQVTRGSAPLRQHAFPVPTTPTLLAMSTPFTPQDMQTLRKGVKAITLADPRWLHCAIKATSLLPNVLLHQNAKDQGADEAILIRDGLVTEGAASNVFIVEQGTIYTTPTSDLLLGGITRDVIIALAKQHDLPLKEAPITRSRLQEADEIWLSSSTREIRPVIALDNQVVGTGKAGACWEELIKYYQDNKIKSDPSP